MTGAPDRQRIRTVVADLLKRHVTVASGGGATSPADDATEVPRDFVAEQDVLAAGRAGSLSITENAIVTPLARETAERYGVILRVAEKGHVPRSERRRQVGSDPAAHDPASRGRRTVALGSDHGGFAMKEALRKFLEGEAGFAVLDLGTHSDASVDYPDFAHAVAGAVARGEAWRGIVIDGMGIGSAMAANRHTGVRAANVRSVLEATNAREHNDANVLCLGGRILGDLLARALCVVFLTTDFAGGRHAKRVAKI